MKRDEHDILMKIPDVDIEISKEVKCNGYFMLICPSKEDNKDENIEYIFEWNPDPNVNPSILTQKNIPLYVSTSTEVVSEIIIRDLSFTEVSVRFILVDSTRLPRFLFHKHPQLHLQHMIDVLINEKVVLPRSDRPNAYKIYHQSTKTDADIFGYTPTSSLSASSAVNLAEHNDILTKLNYQPLAKESVPVSIDEFNKIIGSKLLPTPDVKSPSNDNYDLKEVKKQIFLKGISPEARPYIWPILFGSIPLTSNKQKINEHLEKKFAEFKRIKRRIYLFTEFQTAHSSELRDIKRIVHYDALRNDRQLEAFSGNNPNLGILETVLTCYSLHNRDSGYCQGMADLVSPLILLFIKGWTEPNKSNENNNNDDNNNNAKKDPNVIIVNSDGEEEEGLAGKDYCNGSEAIFYDGTKKNYEEAESFIFWNFVGLMNLTQHHRLFSYLDIGKQFILERSAAIATSVHKPLKALLDKNELNGLDFLFRPILLLFKREFKIEDLFRLWDSMFSFDYPYCFPRFIAASLLIVVYPKFLLYTNGSLGEVMAVLDGSMEKVEVKAVLQIAASLIERVQEPFEKHNFIFEALPFSQKLCDYVPKYLKFIDKI